MKHTLEENGAHHMQLSFVRYTYISRLLFHDKDFYKKARDEAEYDCLF